LKAAPPPALNPANGVTLLRLVLVPVFAVWLMEGKPGPAFAAFTAASLSDLLDGWLARRYGWVTALGVFIDPLADKALQLTAFTLLALKGHCPAWLAVLAWARELLVVSGFALLSLVAQVPAVRSSLLGKGGTLAQMATLAVLLAVQAWPPWARYEALAQLALAGGVLLNFMAGLQYAARGVQAYEAQARAGRRPPGIR
jgi:CDP-diacylglycerol--glycerol-3-phosphate 3-phosphatidyltransferase